MAHDRLKHVTLFRTGTGPAVMLNETLGPIGPKCAWLVEHLEMALANYTAEPEVQHEIVHPIRKLPWKTPEGLPLNSLRIRLARVSDVAEALDADWFADYPINGREIFVVSATLVRH